MEPRRTSYTTGPRKPSNPAMADFEANRRPSLKEIPSYRDEASQHLKMGTQVKSISARLSAGKEILNADPSTKPWLRKTSTPRKASSGSGISVASVPSPLERVSEAGGAGTFTATPALSGGQALAAPSELRTRNLSRS